MKMSTKELSPLLSLPAPDQVQAVFGPQQQATSRDRRSRQRHAFQHVRVLKLELLACRDHESLAFLSRIARILADCSGCNADFGLCSGSGGSRSWCDAVSFRSGAHCRFLPHKRQAVLIARGGSQDPCSRYCPP